MNEFTTSCPTIIQHRVVEMFWYNSWNSPNYRKQQLERHPWWVLGVGLVTCGAPGIQTIDAFLLPIVVLIFGICSSESDFFKQECLESCIYSLLLVMYAECKNISCVNQCYIMQGINKGRPNFFLYLLVCGCQNADTVPALVHYYYIP